jgi:hypothetical protein
MSLDYHSVAEFVKTWPVITGLVAIVTLILGVLSSNGYIDPAVHRSELSVVSNKITDIEKSLEENKTDHKDMRIDTRTIMSTLSRIEGRLANQEFSRGK